MRPPPLLTSNRMTMPAPTVAADTMWSKRAALLRDDFASFGACCFRELDRRPRLALNWPFEVMAGKLVAVRMADAVAPSELACGLGVPFGVGLGHDPSAQILCVTPGL